MINQVPIGFAAEPQQALQIQHIEGGFLVAVPPDMPTGAEDPGELTTTVADWLGARVNEQAQWIAPEVLCPVGAVFAVVKLKRKRGDGNCFLVTRHLAQAPLIQSMVFIPLDALVLLNQWLGTKPPKQADAVSITGYRVNEEIDVNGGDTLILAAETFPAPDPTQMPYRLRSEDGKICAAVMDATAADYLRRELEEDPKGYFAARLVENVLELGPRLAEDGEDAPSF